MQPDNTIEMIGLALDAALMRQTAIAANIANTNTKGYQAIGVDFETQLQNVSESGLNDVKPIYEYTEEPVSIDDQMALSVKNATQYRALIKGLNHKLAIMKLALQGNNASGVMTRFMPSPAWAWRLRKCGWMWWPTTSPINTP